VFIIKVCDYVCLEISSSFAIISASNAAVSCAALELDEEDCFEEEEEEDFPRLAAKNSASSSLLLDFERDGSFVRVGLLPPAAGGAASRERR
jgi:hypothetical protein